jgi:hypothetical protein
MNINDKNYDPRFRDTIFVVEANSFEMMALWSRHSHEGSTESTIRPYKRYKWEHDSYGKTVEVGQIDGHPITITFFWQIIDGYYVTFYERCSWYIDLYQVDAWLLAHCNPTWDSSCRAHCDASNFHHCLNAIDDLNGKR